MALYRVVSSYYVAGIITKKGTVIKSAPILKWTIGKNIKDLKKYFFSKKIEIECISRTIKINSRGKR